MNQHRMSEEVVSNQETTAIRERRRQGMPVMIVSAMLVILTIGLTVMMMRGTTTTKIKLKDGRTLTIHTVTYGRETYFPGNHFPWQPYTKAPTEQLSLWMSLENSPEKPNSYPLHSFIDCTPILVDSHGHKFDENGIGGSYLTPLFGLLPGGSRSSKYVACYRYERFPRREKNLTVQFYDPTGQILGEYTIPNPAYRLVKELVPDPLPATHRVDDLSVTLQSCSLVELESIFASNVKANTYAFVPRVNIQQAGHRSSWEVRNTRISDAAGQGMDTIVSQVIQICPYEPAYRLELSLTPLRDSFFTPEQTSAIHDVSLPTPGKSVTLQGRAVRRSVMIEPLALSFATEVNYTRGANVPGADPSTIVVNAKGNPDFHWNRDLSLTGNSSNAGQITVQGCCAQVALLSSGLRPDQRIFVWATVRDAKGNERRIDQLITVGGLLPDVRGKGSHTDLHVRFVPIPLDANSVDLHFSIGDVKTVEFTVKPEILPK